MSSSDFHRVSCLSKACCRLLISELLCLGLVFHLRWEVLLRAVMPGSTEGPCKETKKPAVKKADLPFNLGSAVIQIAVVREIFS